MKKSRLYRRGLALSLTGGILATTFMATSPASGADPISLTMWTRSVTAVQSQDMVDAFNAANKGKIEVKLTVIPFGDYLQKVGAAASAGNLPDLLAANVIDGPNYTRSGLWLDITKKVKSLSFYKLLAPAHMASATYNHKNYAVPLVVDASSIYYNKVLFRKAGLNPDQPPTSLTEMAADARKIAALGKGVGGFYLAGNCAGCLLFELFPSIWAQNSRVLNIAGNTSYLSSPQAAAVFKIYRDMYADGTMVAASKNETGATQNAAFAAGNVGFTLLGSKALGTIKPSDALEIGIAPLSGPNGGKSTFVGGDTIGISSTSKQSAAAWEFLKWTLQIDPQISLYAAKNFLTSRTDLTNNKYALADPRMVLLNSLVPLGQTPYSPRFFQTFNDANGPWLTLVRTAIFGSGKPNLKSLTSAVNNSLNQ